MKNEQKKRNKIIVFIIFLLSSIIVLISLINIMSQKKYKIESEQLVKEEVDQSINKNPNMPILTFDFSHASLEEKKEMSKEINLYFKSFPSKKYSILLENEVVKSNQYESTYIIIPKVQAIKTYQGRYDVFQRIIFKTREPFCLNDEAIISFQKDIIKALPIPAMIENAIQDD